MRILVDALAPKVGGGRTYILNLLPALLEADPGNTYHILVSKGQFPELEDLNRLNVHSIKISFLPQRLVYQQTIIPLLVKRWKVNVLFSATDITTLAAPCKVVLAIHNPNPYQNLHPLTSTLHWRFRTLLQLSRLSVRKAKKVIFVSEYAKTIASNKLHCPTEKAVVIHHGVNKLYNSTSSNVNTTSSKYNLATRRPYILFASTLYHYKNPVRLVDAFALCCKQPDFNYDLVIAGKSDDPATFTEVQEHIQSRNLSNRIHLLGEVPQSEMPSLYTNASLFVFPSYSETFGLPLVEAMASGVPVAAANTASMPEVAGEAAVYFNPFSIEDIAKTIETVVNDKNLSDSLRQRGLTRANKFSWKRSAEETSRLFREA